MGPNLESNGFRRSPEGFRRTAGCNGTLKTLATKHLNRARWGTEGGQSMPSEGEVWVQLATRIPKQLHRELKLYCVKSDVSVMDFVVSALQDKLARDARSGRAGRRARAS